VYYQNGFKQDLAAIAEIAHARGALFYVDAYQSLGTVPVDVKSMHVDMLSSGVLKYLLGLPGIAFLYIRRELANQLQPSSTGWFGQQNPFAMEVNRLDYATGARRFDTGTPPIIAAYAAEAGLALINEIGVQRIHQRIEHLVNFTLERANQLGLPVLGPRSVEQRGAAVAIAVPDGHHLEEQLKQRGMILSARGPAIRIAPHFFTLEEEISRALQAVRDELQK
jgi:selenocysteine lyase/cysteine desulfurase